MRLALISLLFVALMTRLASAEELPRHITVQGEGRVTTIANLATIRADVTTQALTASDALNANSTAMTKIHQVLSVAGVHEEDQQTSGPSVSPVYGRPDPGGRRPRIMGYRISKTISLRTHLNSALGIWLDALVTAGGNQISGISFSIREPSVVSKTAWRRAVADARRRARIYAKALGVELGEIISLSESPTIVSRAGMLAAAEGRTATPIAPGEQEIVARVTIVYAIKD